MSINVIILYLFKILNLYVPKYILFEFVPIQVSLNYIPMIPH
jgi:hypothetical protein